MLTEPAALRIFLDIGAYEGALSRRAAASGLYRQIHAFEPLLSPLFEPDSGITLHRVAVSNGSRPAEFHCGATSTGLVTNGASLFGDKTTGSLSGTTRVDCVSLSTWLRNTLSDSEIDLHLNCEGAEYLILPDLFATSAIDLVARITVHWHAHKIPSIHPKFHDALKALVESLGLPECPIREEQEC